MALVSSLLCGAQELTTNGAKVVLVVDEKTSEITQIELFSNFQQLKEATIEKNYPNSQFYMGLLKGNYSLKNNEVVPGYGATVTMYTNRQFYPGEQEFVKEDLKPGQQLRLGKIKAKVLSSKKGELIVKTVLKQ